MSDSALETRFFHFLKTGLQIIISWFSKVPTNYPNSSETKCNLHTEIYRFTVYFLLLFVFLLNFFSNLLGTFENSKKLFFD